MASGREGVNMSVLRELKALQALQGPHVVQLLDVFTTKSSLVLVFEYMDCSLEDVIRDKATQLSPADVKAYMQMLLQGLAHVHGRGVVHRDVKPDNMLIGSNSVLKLADFGLARSLEAPSSSPSQPSKLTPQVFGRWYRPPELLMGCCTYGCPVDMWAAGCVLAELLLRRPWFPGVCDMDQLDRIFKALGVPTVQSWPGMADLPHRIDFKPAPGQPLQQLFPQASPECLDLLQQLMQYDPQRRISAAAALQHPYFSSSPAPTGAAQLPRPVSSRGRRDLTVPAIMQELLMRPAVAMPSRTPCRLLRRRQQQQQQGAVRLLRAAQRILRARRPWAGAAARLAVSSGSDGNGAPRCRGHAEQRLAAGQELVVWQHPWARVGGISRAAGAARRSVGGGPRAALEGPPQLRLSRGRACASGRCPAAAAAAAAAAHAALSGRTAAAAAAATGQQKRQHAAAAAPQPGCNRPAAAAVGCHAADCPRQQSGYGRGW
ncbi:kinase-like domain-containing protein [Scenedesmus sp. NREL 46B-D3]|nr:kinase-like domain-containing protein [Scenedesmus sp. NREL 46B-D3]